MNDRVIVNKGEQLPVVIGFLPKIFLGSECYENPDCQIAAKNDLQAAYAWIHLYRDVPKTHSIYKREIERLLLWCTYERGSSLAELKVAEFEAYFSFLKNPPLHWCATRSELRAGRASSQWRPFVGSLSESAFLTAVRILNSFLNYLVEARYLRSNPIKLMRKHQTFSMNSEETQYRVWERMLEADEWEAIQQCLEEMPESTVTEIANKMRTQFLFALGYMVGLRIHEIAGHNWNAFRKLDGLWFLFIRGKGGKLRHVPVNDQLLSFVKVYRLSLNKPALPGAEEQEPLFLSKRTGGALSIRQLYDLVKAIGEMAARKFADDSLKAEKLRKFSTHWLRHMSASHQDKEGIPLMMIRDTLGHSSEAITQIYRHAEHERRHQEMQKMKINVTPRLIELKPEVKKRLLTLSFKGRPMDKTASLGRLIVLMEEELLQELEWERRAFNKDSLLQGFEQRKQVGEGVVMEYVIKDIRDQRLDALKQAILRESEIRLLLCEVKIEELN